MHFDELLESPFGQLPDGREASLFTFGEEGGVQAAVTNYGATLVSLFVPDQYWMPADMVLGFDDVSGYLTDHPYLGSTVGRFANRIAKGQFQIGDQSYQVPMNQGGHALHGGPVGLDKYLWQARAEGNGVLLETESPDGDQGFPGKLKVSVHYQIIDQALVIEYQASTDRDTHLNLTNHAYFNLKGHGNGDILDHVLQIHADQYTACTAELIHTGELVSVRGTSLDFLKSKKIGSRISANDPFTKDGLGYDQNYVLNDRSDRLAAVVTESTSGRKMEVFTTEPGIQLYTANWLDIPHGKNGMAYPARSAFCLETQHFPDSPNHPHFPTTLLKVGERYASRTEYRFSW
ncbi:MAG: aldose epimerase family protein [Bacteroidota bacterium]